MKFAILGLGQFGSALALELATAGHEVTAVDTDSAHISLVQEHVTLAVKADATDPAALAELGLEHMDIVIVAIGEGFEPSILITAQLQRMGIKRIHARVINDVHAHLLDLMGIEGRIRAEAMAAKYLARSLVNAAFLHHYALDDKHAVAEIPAPSFLHGRTLADSGLREKHRLNLITVRRGRRSTDATDDDPVAGVPGPDFTFQAGDHLIVFSTEADLQRFTGAESQ